MKRGLLLIVLLGLAGGRVPAQQHALGVSSSATVTGAAIFDERLSSLLVEKTSVAEQEVVISKKLRAIGPLVRPFKASRFWEFPGRLLHSINPFARTEPREEMHRNRALSPSAWATVVGWYPGQSSFPDPLSHESSMGLISLGRP